MTFKLLDQINAGRSGAFAALVARFRSRDIVPRVAWYPSAGDDFRDLICLTDSFAKRNPGVIDDPDPPDIFVHTDYLPHSGLDRWRDGALIYKDSHTRLLVSAREELPSLDLPLDARLVAIDDVSTGRVIFFELDISSDRHGSFRVPLLYMQVENAAFCAKVLLTCEARVSHIVQVRYGAGEGGARTDGSWLQIVSDALKTEVIVSDPHLHPAKQPDMKPLRVFPELRAVARESRLKAPIRRLAGSRWSCHGHVTWWREPAQDSEPLSFDRSVWVPSIAVRGDHREALRRMQEAAGLELDELLSLIVRNSLDRNWAPTEAALAEIRGVWLPEGRG